VNPARRERVFDGIVTRASPQQRSCDVMVACHRAKVDARVRFSALKMRSFYGNVKKFVERM
jgi:hypothetical protein